MYEEVYAKTGGFLQLAGKLADKGRHFTQKAIFHM